MRFLIVDKAARRRREIAEQTWHPCFAWRPVYALLTDGVYGWIWLEPAQRQRDASYQAWKYRAVTPPPRSKEDESHARARANAGL